MRVSKRQILELIYEQQVQDSATPEEVEPEEDVWASGPLDDPIDWQDVSTGEPVEPGIEVAEIVERLKRRLRLKRIIREQVTAAVEEKIVEPVVEPQPVSPEEGEERASASQQSLRDWLKNTAASVAGFSIPDGQIPSLIASMDDLILSAQSGKMASREDKVRAHIDTE